MFHQSSHNDAVVSMSANPYVLTILERMKSVTQRERERVKCWFGSLKKTEEKIRYKEKKVNRLINNFMIYQKGREKRREVAKIYKPQVFFWLGTGLDLSYVISMENVNN